MVYLIFQTLIQTSKKFVWISTTAEQADSTPKLGTVVKYPESNYLWI